MLHISREISEQELPQLVRETFINGAPYLHISGLEFGQLEAVQRSEKIRTLGLKIGSLTLSNENPESDIWELDSSTSPHAQLVRAHTDNPFLDYPEDIVAFWNIRSSTTGGENIITPLARVLELGERSPQLAEIIEKARSCDVTFTHGGNSWTGTPIDSAGSTIRYDAKYLSTPDEELERLFEESASVGDAIKLSPGEVVFFNNRTTVHARLPYSDPDRLNIRTRIRLSNTS